MRFGTIIIGGALFVFSIALYGSSSNLMSSFMNFFIVPGSSSAMHGIDVFTMMGLPSMDTISKFIQYCFLGLAVAGICITLYGFMAKKKIPRQFKTKPTLQEMKEPFEKIEGDAKLRRFLSEKLSKGEISSSQYRNFRDLLDR